MVYTTRNLKRQKKIRDWENRIELLHKKFPRLGEINHLFAQMAKELALLELEKSTMGMSREELLKAQEALQSEKKQLIKKHKLPDNIYEIWWDCPKCQDTGFIEIGKKCSCLLSEEFQVRWQESGLSPEQKQQTFTTFTLDWYKDKERYRDILEQCLLFCEKVHKGEKAESLLFCGPVGTGKTHLCSAIANYLLQSGLAVIYLKSGKLFDLIREYKFGPEANEQGTIRKLDFLYRADLLIIDDLGTESLTDFTKEQLLFIIDERIQYKLPWVISTNLSPHEMTNYYEDRILDRILNVSKIMKFTGESVRKLQSLEKKAGLIS